MIVLTDRRLKKISTFFIVTNLFISRKVEDLNRKLKNKIKMQRSIENVPRAASRPSRIPLLARKANGYVAIGKENILEIKQTNLKVNKINKRGIENVPLVTNCHQGFKIHQDVNCETCKAGNATNDKENNEETLDWTSEEEILKELIMNISVFPEFIDKEGENEQSDLDEDTLDFIRRSEEFIENLAPNFPEVIGKDDEIEQSDEDMLLESEEDLQELESALQDSTIPRYVKPHRDTGF